MIWAFFLAITSAGLGIFFTAWHFLRVCDRVKERLSEEKKALLKENSDLALRLSELEKEVENLKSELEEKNKKIEMLEALLEDRENQIKKLMRELEERRTGRRRRLSI